MFIQNYLHIHSLSLHIYYDGPLTHVCKRRGKRIENRLEGIGPSEAMRVYERRDKKVAKGV